MSHKYPSGHPTPQTVLLCGLAITRFQLIDLNILSGNPIQGGMGGQDTSRELKGGERREGGERCGGRVVEAREAESARGGDGKYDAKGNFCMSFRRRGCEGRKRSGEGGRGVDRFGQNCVVGDAR